MQGQPQGLLIRVECGTVKIYAARERDDLVNILGWPLMANALTAIRLLLVVPFAFFMARGDERSTLFALIAWVAALTTDFLDGPIARRRGTVSPLSGAFDHTSDFLFVVSGIFAGAFRGVFPWILPICITAAFAQYAIDSYWLHRQIKFRGSKLGRYNGMLYFVPPCMDILIRMGARRLQPLLTILVWVLVLSTLVSMGQRLIFSRLAAAEHFSSGAPEK
jgi:CDP-diacylglycerol---glycerol-3-phosphate 3-phosphatidyltransferase